MTIYAKPISVGRETCERLDSLEPVRIARCLAVLVAAATALTDLHSAIVKDEQPELVILDLLLSLTNICAGDGVQLRTDADVIAKRLGCTLIAADTPLPANLN